MSNTDLAVLRYLRLATISKGKQQLAGCDKFLILAGASACHAGVLGVAESCREHVLAHNPRHLLSRWASMPDALRSEDFVPYLKQLERFCGIERAEILLAELEEDVVLDPDALLSEQAQDQFRDPVWVEES